MKNEQITLDKTEYSLRSYSAYHYTLLIIENEDF